MLLKLPSSFALTMHSSKEIVSTFFTTLEESADGKCIYLFSCGQKRVQNLKSGYGNLVGQSTGPTAWFKLAEPANNLLQTCYKLKTASQGKQCYYLFPSKVEDTPSDPKNNQLRSK